MNILTLDFLPTTGQTIFFDWISIIFLVIVLITFLVGIKQGFLLTLLSLFGVLLSLVIAFFVAKPLGELISSSTGWGQSVSNSINTWLLGKNEMFGAVINKATAEAQLPFLFQNAGIPSFLIGTLTSLIVPLIPDVGTKAIGIYMADGLSSLLFIVGAFLVTFIVLMIVLGIVKLFAKGLNKVPLIGWVNRLLGGVFGIVIGVLFVVVLTYGINLLVTIPEANTWISEQLKLTDPNSWSIGKMLYENNFLQKLLEMYIK